MVYCIPNIVLFESGYLEHLDSRVALIILCNYLYESVWLTSGKVDQLLLNENAYTEQEMQRDLIDLMEDHPQDDF